MADRFITLPAILENFEHCRDFSGRPNLTGRYQQKMACATSQSLRAKTPLFHPRRGGATMIRAICWLVCISSCLASIGCCGPLVCGGPCGSTGCHDCDGVGYGERVIPYRPLDGLRQLRKNIVCGSGCGEVYVGEWISTPPDCSDPCCGDQFVGGATPCRPGCWEPGLLLRNLYGGRFCDGALGDCCDCGVTGCDGGCHNDGTWIEEGTVPSESPTPAARPAENIPNPDQAQRQRRPATDNLTRAARRPVANRSVNPR